MKNKLFSGGVYAEAMKKLRVFGFISLAIMLLAEIAPTFTAYIERSEYLAGRLSPDVVEFHAFCPAVFFTAIIVTPIMMFTLFSGFNKRAFCDFYHALPYTRTCIFVSFIAAVLTWVVGISVISAAVGIAVRLAMPWAYVLSFAGFGKCCLIYFIVAMYLCAAIALASSVTGTLLSNVTVSGLIIFLPRYIAYFMCLQITDGSSLLVNTSTYIPFFSPRYNLFIAAFTNLVDIYGYRSTVSTAGPIAYTAVVTVLYLIAAAILFSKRKSEVAGQSAPGRKTQTVVRTALTLVPSILGTCMFMTDEVSIGFFLWILAAIVYFAYEILTTLRWHNLLKALPFIAIVIALNGVFAFSALALRAAAISYRPAADEIDSVRFIESISSDDYFEGKISEIEISDKEVLSIVADALSDSIDREKSGNYFSSSNYTVTRTVAIREGFITRYRSIDFRKNDYEKLTDLLKNNDDLKNKIMALPTPLYGSMSTTCLENITPEQCDEIIKILQEEIYEKGFETWFLTQSDRWQFDRDEKYYIDDTYSGNYMFDQNANRIFISYNVNAEKNPYVYIGIDSSIYPKTFEYIAGLSWNEAKDSLRLKNILDLLKKTDGKTIANGDISYFDVNLNARCNNRHYFVFYCEDRYLDSEDIASGYYDDKKKNTKNAPEILCALLDRDGGEMPKADRYAFIEVSTSYSPISYEYDYNRYGSLAFYAPIPDDFDFADYKLSHVK